MKQIRYLEVMQILAIIRVVGIKSVPKMFVSYEWDQ